MFYSGALATQAINHGHNPLSPLLSVLCDSGRLTHKVTSTLYMLVYEHEVDGGSSYILSVCVSVSVHKMV